MPRLFHAGDLAPEKDMAPLGGILRELVPKGALFVAESALYSEVNTGLTFYAKCCDCAVTESGISRKEGSKMLQF